MINEQEILSLIDRAGKIAKQVEVTNHDAFEKKWLDLTKGQEQFEEYQRRVLEGEIDFLSTIPYGTEITEEYTDASTILARIQHFPKEYKESTELFVEQLKELIRNNADKALLHNLLYSLEDYVQQMMLYQKSFTAVANKSSEFQYGNKNQTLSVVELKQKRLENIEKQDNLISSNLFLEEQLRVLCRYPGTPKEQIERLKEQIRDNESGIEKHAIKNIYLMTPPLLKRYHGITMSLEKNKLAEQKTELEKMFAAVKENPQMITQRKQEGINEVWDRNIFPKQYEKACEVLDSVRASTATIEYTKSLLAMNVDDQVVVLKDLVYKKASWQEMQQVYQRLEDFVSLGKEFQVKENTSEIEIPQQEIETYTPVETVIDSGNSELQMLKGKIAYSEQNLEFYQNLKGYDPKKVEELIKGEAAKIDAYQELYTISLNSFNKLQELQPIKVEMTNTQKTILNPLQEFKSIVGQLKVKINEEIYQQENSQLGEDTAFVDSAHNEFSSSEESILRPSEHTNFITEQQEITGESLPIVRSHESGTSLNETSIWRPKSLVTENEVIIPEAEDNDLFDLSNLIPRPQPMTTENSYQSSKFTAENPDEFDEYGVDSMEEDNLTAVSDFFDLTPEEETIAKNATRKLGFKAPALFIGTLLTTAITAPVIAQTSSQEMPNVSTQMAGDTKVNINLSNSEIVNLVDRAMAESEEEKAIQKEISKIQIGDSSDKIHLDFLMMKGALANTMQDAKGNNYTDQIDEQKINQNREYARVTEFAVQKEDNTIISGKVGESLQEFMKNNNIHDINEVQFKVGYALEENGQLVRPASGKVGWANAEDIVNGYRYANNNSQNIAQEELGTTRRI